MDDKKNEVLEYKNILNDIAFTKFGEADFNLLFSILLLAKKGINSGKLEKDDKGNPILKIDYSVIKSMAELKNDHIPNNKFHDEYLKKMTYKLLLIRGTIPENNGQDVDLVVFPRFIRDRNNAQLIVPITDDFQKILYEFDEIGFTKLELKNFVSIESKYTKTLYRKLSQFRSSGKYVVKQETFRELFDVPASYNQSDIMKRIINPAVKTLTEDKNLKDDFPNLKCETHKAPKRGAPVDRYIFTFVAKPRKRKNQQTEGQSDMDQATEEMQKYKKQKAKSKNSFNDFMQSPSYLKIDEEFEKKVLDN